MSSSLTTPTLNQTAIELGFIAQMHQQILGGKGWQGLRETTDVSPYCGTAPWVNPPEGHLPFAAYNAVAVPAAPPVHTPVLTLSVPEGLDGVIIRLSQNFTGGGFVAGSGDIIWRITADG